MAARTASTCTPGISLNDAFEKVALVPVWAEVPHLFPDQYRAAMAWAEEVTLVSDTHASDEAYAAASTAFAPKDLVDLTITIAAMNAFNRLGAPFRLPVQQKFSRFCALSGAAPRRLFPARYQSISGGSSTSHVADFFRACHIGTDPPRHWFDGRLKAQGAAPSVLEQGDGYHEDRGNWRKRLIGRHLTAELSRQGHEAIAARRAAG